MRNYQMFTVAGNIAVGAIVEKAVALHTVKQEAYEYAYDELISLSEVDAFSEATDTAVREEVWEVIYNHFS